MHNASGNNDCHAAPFQVNLPLFIFHYFNFILIQRRAFRANYSAEFLRERERERGRKIDQRPDLPRVECSSWLVPPLAERGSEPRDQPKTARNNIAFAIKKGRKARDEERRN